MPLANWLYADLTVLASPKYLQTKILGEPRYPLPRRSISPSVIPSEDYVS
jgi:hypothetical protein